MENLPKLVEEAAEALSRAKSAAEVLAAKAKADVAYVAAKKASYAATDAKLAVAHKAQADALKIDFQADCWLADGLANGGIDVELTPKQISEAKLVRDALKKLNEAIDAKLTAGEQILRSDLMRAFKTNGVKRLVEDRARTIVRPRIEKKQPIQARKLGEEHNISHTMVEQAAAMERARLELLNELGIDPRTLSVSAKAKLEVAKRLVRRELELEYAARVSQFDKEVQQKVIEDGKQYRDTMNEMRSKAERTEEFYKEAISNHKWLFTAAQFKVIQMCLHPDGIRTSEKLHEAFQLFTAKKLPLTGER